MSTCYNIGCRDCKTSIWIGQSSCDSEGHMYYGPDYSPKHWTWLRKHQGHTLEFNVDAVIEMRGMEEET